MRHVLLTFCLFALQFLSLLSRNAAMNVIAHFLLLTFSLVYTILTVTLSTFNDGYSSFYCVDSSVPGACPAANNDADDDNAIPVHREVYGSGKIIDISHQYHPQTPLWGSDAGLGEFLRLQHSMKNGSLSNSSEMKVSVHAGTHVDAPGHLFDHYFDAGFDVDTLDLEILNGPAILVEIPRDKNITAEVMKSLKIPKGVRRVLFRTLNTDRQLMKKKEFDSSYSGFTTDGAHWLVKNTAIQLIGIDYMSVAAYDETVPAHRVFLESREIILLESLKLDNVQPGIYTLHCLPLRLMGSEGSPTRCILIQ